MAFVLTRAQNSQHPHPGRPHPPNRRLPLPGARVQLLKGAHLELIVAATWTDRRGGAGTAEPKAAVMGGRAHDDQTVGTKRGRWGAQEMWAQLTCFGFGKCTWEKDRKRLCFQATKKGACQIAKTPTCLASIHTSVAASQSALMQCHTSAVRMSHTICQFPSLQNDHLPSHITTSNKGIATSNKGITSSNVAPFM